MLSLGYEPITFFYDAALPIYIFEALTMCYEVGHSWVNIISPFLDFLNIQMKEKPTTC